MTTSVFNLHAPVHFGPILQHAALPSYEEALRQDGTDPRVTRIVSGRANGHSTTVPASHRYQHTLFYSVSPALLIHPILSRSSHSHTGSISSSGGGGGSELAGISSPPSAHGAPTTILGQIQQQQQYHGAGNGGGSGSPHFGRRSGAGNSGYRNPDQQQIKRTRR